MTTPFRIAVPCALVLGLAAGATQAQNVSPDQRETWTESSRTQVWKNAFGECWHSAYGPPPPANLCGPQVAQYTPPPAPAPVIVAPPTRLAPEPAPAVAPPPPAPAPVVAPAPRRDRG